MSWDPVKEGLAEVAEDTGWDPVREGLAEVAADRMNSGLGNFLRSIPSGASDTGYRALQGASAQAAIAHESGGSRLTESERSDLAAVEREAVQIARAGGDVGFSGYMLLGAGQPLGVERWTETDQRRFEELREAARGIWATRARRVALAARDNGLMRASEWFGGMREEVARTYSVDPEFAESLVGQIAHGLGQLGFYIPAGLTGPLGWAAMQSTLYQEAVDDYRATVGEEANPQEEMRAGLAYSLPGVVLEKAGVSAILGRLFGQATRTGGRLTAKQVVARFGREAAQAGLVEGVTEAMQGMLQDFLASASFDPDRELLSREAFLQRFHEFVVGLAVGAVGGGGRSVVQDLDLVRAQRSAAPELASDRAEAAVRDVMGEGEMGSKEESGIQPEFTDPIVDRVLEESDGDSIGDVIALRDSVDPEVQGEAAAADQVESASAAEETAVDGSVVAEVSVDPGEGVGVAKVPQVVLESIEAEASGSEWSDPPAVSRDLGPDQDRVLVAEAPEGVAFRQAWIPVSVLQLSEDVPQFKAAADEQGVVKGQELGTFRQEIAGPIAVWERLGGALEVISGRHRLAAARRDGIERIDARVFKEADGFNAQAALTFDAELNIMDGQGTIKDYAKYFKNTPGYTEQAARARGLLARAKGARGWILGRLAEDDLYDAYANGQIPEEKAIAIARGAPNSVGVQQIALRKAGRQGMSAAELEIFARQLAEGTRGASAQGKQMGLFGEDDSAAVEAEKIARAAIARVRRNEERVRSVKGAAKNPKAAAEMGLDVNNPAALLQEVARLEEENARLRTFPTGELLQEVRREAGLGVIEGIVEEHAQGEGKSDQKNDDEASDSAQDTFAFAPERRGLDRRSAVFVRNFFGRLRAADPVAFRRLKIVRLSPDEWRVRMPASVKARHAAYSYTSSTIFLRADEGMDGGGIVSFLVHEAGHFADDFLLPREVTEGAWTRLGHERRLSAWREYLGEPDAEIGEAQLLASVAARREWVAMQFARVVRGESEAMAMEGQSPALVSRLRAWLREVRDLVREFVGSRDLADEEVDAKITALLQFADAKLVPVDNRGSRAVLGARTEGLGVGGELGTPLGAEGVDLAAEADPRANRLVIELPEMVEMVRELLGGKYPQVARRMPGALGMYRYRADGLAVDRGDIRLLASVFNLVSSEEHAQLREMANDWSRANVTEVENPTDAHDFESQVQRVADERYRYLLGQLTEKRMHENPKVASKVLAHELGHLVDNLPDGLLRSRGNILGRLASLHRYFKSTLAELPQNQADVLTARDRRRLRREAERRVGPRPPRDEEADLEAWREEVSRIYREDVLPEEIERRGLVSRMEVVEELRGLSSWWYGQRPDTITAYQEKPEELYADAFSVFINNPQAVRARAPKYYRVLQNWMEVKPEVATLYESIQQEIARGSVHERRVERLRDAFDRVDREGVALRSMREPRGVQERLDAVRVAFDRASGAIYRRFDSSEAANQARLDVGRFIYRGTEHELIISRFNEEVAKPLVELGLTWADLGEYLFHRRVVNERANIANPHGWNPKASFERLDGWARQLGTQGYLRLRQAAKAFRTVYEEEVVSLLRDSEVFDADLQTLLEENVYYATFDVAREVPERTIEALLDNRFGKGVGAGIYKQHGTLKDVANPATATVQKAMSLISMAYRERAKRSVVEFLRETGEAVRAEYRWDGRRRAPVPVSNERMKTVTYVHKGELEAWHVPYYVAQFFETESPGMVEIQGRLAAANNLLKGLFTQLNYGFWPVAAIRDVGGWSTQLPGANLVFGKSAFVRYLPQALRGAVSSVRGSPDKTALEVLRRGMMVPHARRGGRDESAGNEFERELLAFGIEPAAWQVRTEREFGRFARWWRAYTRLGEVGERTFKVAGMLYLDERFPDMPEWRKQELVRERAGSPDFLQKPKYNAVMDTFVGLYYNAIKEGFRSIGKSTKEMPGRMAWNYSKFVLPGTGLMVLASTGALRFLLGDDDADELQQMMGSIPEYFKTNYLCIPLGWDDRAQGKVAFVSFPLFEGWRLAHALTWKAWGAASGRPQSLQQAASYAGGQLPTQNPIVDAASAWWSYVIEGRNPYDSFRGREIIEDKRFEAGWRESFPTMAKWTWNTMGGGVIWRLDEDRLDAPDRTGLEKFLGAPVVSNLVGRWLRISNRGIEEQMRQIEEPINQERARKRVVAEELSWKVRSGGGLSQQDAELIRDDEYLQDYFFATLVESELRRLDPRLRGLRNARSSEGREAIMRELLGVE